MKRVSVTFSSDEKEALIASQAKLDLIGLDLVFFKMYSRLISEHSDISRLFAGTDIGKQVRMFRQIFVITPHQLLNDEGELERQLVRISKHHQALDVGPEHYRVMRATLLDVLRRVAGLGEAEIQLWGKLFDYMAERMAV